MNALLTGSSSFTGLWFVRALTDSGRTVVATMTRSDPKAYDDPLRALRVREVERRASVEWSCTFGDERFIELIGSGAFDVLCHHGADVTDYKSEDFDYTRALANNTRSARRVLEAFKDAGGQAVVLTGSVFEGGEGAGSDGLPHFSPYGLSKALTREVFEYECRRAGLALGRFVIPNPFGPLEEPRFTAYLVRTWASGQMPCVRTPAYVRDNIHVSVLAREYARFVERVHGYRAGDPLVFSPSGYVESQGRFAERFAAELGPRLGIPTPLDFAEQTEFAEPRVRIGLDPAAMDAQEESSAWDALADDYRVRLLEQREPGAAERGSTAG